MSITIFIVFCTIFLSMFVTALYYDNFIVRPLEKQNADLLNYYNNLEKLNKELSEQQKQQQSNT